MKRSPIPLILMAAALSGAGCYTILRHPGPSMDLTDESGEQKECADCHSDADLYHLPGELDNGWYSYYPTSWAAYYAPPWWIDDGYWHAPHRPEAPAPIVETDQRHAWSRDATIGPVLPSQGGGNTTVSSPPGTGKPAGNTQEKPTEGGKNDAEKEKKRHVWGR